MRSSGNFTKFYSYRIRSPLKNATLEIFMKITQKVRNFSMI